MITHPWKDPKFEQPPSKTLVIAVLNNGKAFTVLMREGKLWSDVTAWMDIPAGYRRDSGA